MSHPYTAEARGFRQFHESSFGELQETEWDFDGTIEDVREFAHHNLGSVESVRDCGAGTFDVTTESGEEYRIYTVGTES